MNDKILELLKEAESHGISTKKQVGCVVVSVNYENNGVKYFSGSNIHISDSFADEHAEQFAIKKSLLENYYPTILYVTSSRDKEPVFLCGLCREFVSSINCDMRIHVVNTNTGKIIGSEYIRNVFPNSKNFEKKNHYWLKRCGMKIKERIIRS